MNIACTISIINRRNFYIQTLFFNFQFPRVSSKLRSTNILKLCIRIDKTTTTTRQVRSFHKFDENEQKVRSKNESFSFINREHL